MLVSVSNVQKSFSIYTVLDQVTFQINEGDKIGIVGINGSGKTTLFKIITGLENPDSGEVFVRKQTKIGYLDQIPEYNKTVIEVLHEAFEDIFIKEKQLKQLEKELSNNYNEHTLRKYGYIQEEFEMIGGYEVETTLKKIIKGLNIKDGQLDRNFDTLSGGEKSRVILAKILLEKPDLLLLDEPTNHLDLSSILWLESYLSAYKGAILIISHDRYLLDRTVNNIINIENGKSKLYKGNYSFYIKEKALYMESLWKEYEAQNRKVAKMEEQIDRYRIWGKMRDSDKMYRRAKELEKRLDRMEDLDKPFENKTLKFKFNHNVKTGKEVIQFKDISIGYDTNLVSHFNHTIRYGEKVFLVGDNGTGKTSLFKAIFNEIHFDGEIKIGSRVEIGNIEQEVSYPTPESTILQEYRRIIPVGDGEARNHLAQFLFFGDDVFKKVKDISGGEKSRLELCKLVYSNKNVLLLDEPTNHLDIDTKEMLESTLIDFPGTLFIISHDRYFIDKLADYVLGIDHKTISSHDSFNQYFENIVVDDVVDKDKTKRVRHITDEKREKELNEKILRLEEAIQTIELSISTLLEDTDVDYAKISSLVDEKESLELEYLSLIDEI